MVLNLCLFLYLSCRNNERRILINTQMEVRAFAELDLSAVKLPKTQSLVLLNIKFNVIDDEIFTNQHSHTGSQHPSSRRVVEVSAQHPMEKPNSV